MNIAQLIDSYVAHKRSLGKRFVAAEKQLRAFERAIDLIEISKIDEMMVQGYLDRTPVTTSWHVKYYALRGLFQYAVRRDLIEASPMPYLIPKRAAYATPYIYSSEELRSLLDATRLLAVHHPKNGMRSGIQPLTFRTLILLLYGAGLRLTEALSLTTEEVDFAGRCIVIRDTKFFKTRLLPIGPKLTSALELYAEHRVALAHRLPTTSAFFVGRSGTAISRETAERYFRLIRDGIGLKRLDGAYFRPRLHDLRATFAVHRLVAWYRAGSDVQRLLPQLSTYLGHVGLAETQHYLTMTPELLREASCRFQGYANQAGGDDQ